MNVQRTFLMILATVLLICQASFLAAAERTSWPARASANVNLRSAPGLHGAVITGLTGGTELQILDQADGWVKVAHQNDTFGFQGWVYGQYVQRIDEPVAEKTAPQGLTAVGSQPTETGAATSIPLAASGTASQLTAVSAAPAAPPQNMAAPVAPLAVAPRETLPEKAILAEPARVNAQNAVETNGSEPSAAVSKDVLSTPSPAKHGMTPPTQKAASTGMLTWLSLVLRLSTVIMATMALFMANRAVQMARESGYRPTRT